MIKTDPHIYSKKITCSVTEPQRIYVYIYHVVNFTFPGKYIVKTKKKKPEKLSKFSCLPTEYEKAIEYEGDGYTNYFWRTYNCFQKSGKKIEELENRWKIAAIKPIVYNPEKLWRSNEICCQSDSQKSK